MLVQKSDNSNDYAQHAKLIYGIHYRIFGWKKMAYKYKEPGLLFQCTKLSDQVFDSHKQLQKSTSYL